VVYATTNGGDKPSAPSYLTAVAQPLDQISLSWSNVANEWGYKVERSPNGWSGWEQIATTWADSTSYVDSGLSADTTYYYRVRAYNAVDGEYSPTASATTGQPPTSTDSTFVVGGEYGYVELRQVGTGATLALLDPFGYSFTGATSVALGDLNADGYRDVVVGMATAAALVKIYDGKTLETSYGDPESAVFATFYAFDPQYNVGVNVALGDVNGDGYADLVAGANVGNPHVKIYSGQALFYDPAGAIIADFYAYGLQFNVGAAVAAGDIDRDGFAEVITGATIGNPHVKIYSGYALTMNGGNANAALKRDFFAYGLQFNIGVFVATGDTNGDGYIDLITGASRGNPEIKVYDGQAIGLGYFNPQVSVLTAFLAFGSGQDLGAHVGAVDYNGDGQEDILAGTSKNFGLLRIFPGNASGVEPPAFLEESFFSDSVAVGG
jgi:hypothetical protein